MPTSAWIPTAARRRTARVLRAARPKRHRLKSPPADRDHPADPLAATAAISADREQPASHPAGPAQPHQPRLSPNNITPERCGTRNRPSRSHSSAYCMIGLIGQSGHGMACLPDHKGSSMSLAVACPASPDPRSGVPRDTASGRTSATGCLRTATRVPIRIVQSDLALRGPVRIFRTVAARQR